MSTVFKLDNAIIDNNKIIAEINENIKAEIGFRLLDNEGEIDDYYLEKIDTELCDTFVQLIWLTKENQKIEDLSSFYKGYEIIEKDDKYIITRTFDNVSVTVTLKKDINKEEFLTLIFDSIRGRINLNKRLSKFNNLWLLAIEAIYKENFLLGKFLLELIDHGYDGLPQNYYDIADDQNFIKALKDRYNLSDEFDSRRCYSFLVSDLFDFSYALRNKLRFDFCLAGYKKPFFILCYS